MSTAVEDCTIQRVAGVEEQGCSKGIWKVLEEGLFYCQTYAPI